MRKQISTFLMNHAESHSDRKTVDFLLENAAVPTSQAILGELYQSAVDKSHINFETIPHTKGDVTKYEGYTNMVKVLDIIDSLAETQKVRIDETTIVRTSLNYLVAHRATFEKGFMQDNDIVILTYNTLVYSTVDATSLLISSYIDMIKQPDASVELKILGGRERRSGVFQTLDRFNRACVSGEFSTYMRTLVDKGKSNLVGVEVAVVAVAVGAAFAIIPLIRELIFTFYYSRMKLSDYLNQQAQLVQLNKLAVESNSTMSASKKKEVIKNQDNVIQKLHRWADKVAVDDAARTRSAQNELQAEKQKFTPTAVHAATVSNSNDSGYSLL